jgi:hypothetical protein
MSKISVAWDNDDKTVCKYEFQQGWDWQDYYQAIKSAEEMLKQIEHPVNVIMDFRKASLLPNGAINQVQKALAYPRNANVRLTAIVGANTFIRTIADIGQKLARKQNWDLVFVTSLEEAHKHFESRKVKESNLGS